jgi:respiratory burst oxidase
MVDSSKEFAVGIFDALARRRRQNLERITKEELYDFWLQISDQSFDARLQIFFDMYCTWSPFSLFQYISIYIHRIP